MNPVVLKNTALAASGRHPVTGHSTGTKPPPYYQALSVEYQRKVTRPKIRYTSPLTPNPVEIVYDIDMDLSYVSPPEPLSSSTRIPNPELRNHLSSPLNTDPSCQTYDLFPNPPQPPNKRVFMQQTLVPHKTVEWKCKEERNYNIATLCIEDDLLEHDYEDFDVTKFDRVLCETTGVQKFTGKKLPIIPKNIKVTFKNDRYKGKDSAVLGAKKYDSVEFCKWDRNKLHHRDVLSHSNFSPRIYKNEHFLRSLNPEKINEIPKLVKQCFGPIYTPAFPIDRQDGHVVYPDVKVVEAGTVIYIWEIERKEILQKRRKEFEEKQKKLALEKPKIVGRKIEIIDREEAMARDAEKKKKEEEKRRLYNKLISHVAECKKKREDETLKSDKKKDWLMTALYKSLSTSFSYSLTPPQPINSYDPGPPKKPRQAFILPSIPPPCISVMAAQELLPPLAPPGRTVSTIKEMDDDDNASVASLDFSVVSAFKPIASKGENVKYYRP